MKKLPFLTSLLGLLTLPLQAEPPKPHGALPSQRQLKWHELEQYGFCHFTINTFTDKEWGYGDEDPRLFNPTDFNADLIVRSAKAAGLKGLILTCKHHDGFCLWPTKTTKHNISASSWKDGKGDIVREFSDSCRENGLKFGVYLSPWDRNSKHYGTPTYIKQQRAQLTELLTNYGDIFEIWFDGANGGDGFYGGAREARSIDRHTYYGWKDTWKLCNRLQPSAVIMCDIGPDLRWIGNEHGAASIPCYSTYTAKGLNGNPPCIGKSDRRVGPIGTKNGKAWVPGECDVSIRAGWFYHKNQNSTIKTPKRLYELYFASVGRGASLLLNLAPDKRGQLHSNDLYSLTAYGKAIEQLFSKNLAQEAKASASITRREEQIDNFSPDNALDGNRYTYWATPDNTRKASLTLELKGKQTFDVIRLREPIQLGQRIDAFNIEVRINGKWIPWITKGRTIGAHTLLRSKKPITADAIRVNITEASACPLLSEVSLWVQPSNIPNQFPVQIKENEISRLNWKVSAKMNSSDHPATHAIDGNPITFWCSHNGTARKHDVPQTILIDFSEIEKLKSIEVTPRQDGSSHAVVDKYEFSLSLDGKTWSPVINGVFANIRNSPVARLIELPEITTARYLRFTATSVLEKNNVTIAEIKAFK